MSCEHDIKGIKISHEKFLKVLLKKGIGIDGIIGIKGLIQGNFGSIDLC